MKNRIIFEKRVIFINIYNTNLYENVNNNNKKENDPNTAID